MLNLEQRSAQLGVWMLTSTGQAEVCGKAPNLDAVRGKQTLNLYRLTKRGYYMLHRDQNKKR